MRDQLVPGTATATATAVSEHDDCSRAFYQTHIPLQYDTADGYLHVRVECQGGEPVSSPIAHARVRLVQQSDHGVVGG